MICRLLTAQYYASYLGLLATCPDAVTGTAASASKHRFTGRLVVNDTGYVQQTDNGSNITNMYLDRNNLLKYDVLYDFLQYKTRNV